MFNHIIFLSTRCLLRDIEAAKFEITEMTQLIEKYEKLHTKLKTYVDGVSKDTLPSALELASIPLDENKVSILWSSRKVKYTYKYK